MSKRTLYWATCLGMAIWLTLVDDPKSAFIFVAAAFVIAAMDEKK